jgi:hypothetical protein
MSSATDWEMPYYGGYNLVDVQRRIRVAKQNYSFEKRQKELAKKKKKEEKRLKKAGVEDDQPEGVESEDVQTEDVQTEDVQPADEQSVSGDEAK